MNNSELNRLNYKMKAMRLALGLTQDELGGLVGISGVVISLHERGLIDSSYATAIESKLQDVWEKKVAKYGYWYNYYLSLQSATNEIQIWLDAEGYVPDGVMNNAKACAVAFSNYSDS